MSRISKSTSSFNIYSIPTTPVINKSGFAAQNNVINIGFRKSAYGQGKWIAMAASQL